MRRQKKIRSLRHKYIGYGKTTTRDMVNHLYSTYAKISLSDFQDNDASLSTPYNANHPIENLTYQIENAVKYVAAGKTLYTPK